MPEFELLTAVAVLRDIPEDKLVRGQVGTIIEELVPGAYLVEFCDKEGHPYAVVAAKSDDLMRLHYGPMEKAK
jgi:hypothetical protein